jgi:hypothetical protein
MGEVFGMIEKLGSGFKGEGEKYNLGKLMAQQLFGADYELAKIIGATFEEKGSLQGLLANKEIMERIKTAQEMSALTEKDHLQGIHSAVERQDKNQMLSFRLQRIMLDLTTSAVGMFSAYMLKLVSVGYEIKLIMLKIYNFFAGDEKSEREEKILTARIEMLDDANKKLLEASEKSFKKAFDEFTTELTENKTLTEMLKNLGTITKNAATESFTTVTTGVGDAIDSLTKPEKELLEKYLKNKSPEERKKFADVLKESIPQYPPPGYYNDHKYNDRKKDKSKKTKTPKKEHHFGGMLEKFHYGGIIKQGNEALLITPNPTAVLSPSDTRQAVRGSNEKHIHIHFNAPVYGIPKFEEMVNRIVMKAATGIR